MSDHSYKCPSARATASRIWSADFYYDSYNELIESKNPDSVIASVGLSDLSGPDRKLNMVVTIQAHPWGQEIADFLIDEILSSDPPLEQWSISYKNRNWTLALTWRN
jgi:hypothetical protein